MNLNRYFVLILALIPLSTIANESLITAVPSTHLLSAKPNDSERSIDGYGRAVEEVICDQILFTLRFKADGENNDDALENARVKMTNTQNSVKKHGYKLVATALTDLRLSRTSQSSGRRMSGYVQYEFVVGDFNDPLLLMSQVISQEVDRVDNLSYQLVDPSGAVARLKEEALDQAFVSARAQAIKVGAELQELVDVQFSEIKPGRSNHPMRKIQVAATARYRVSGRNQ